MLDANALSQLKQLKQDIDHAKERATASIKGTNRRFGFAILEDGREIFLPQDEMDKVLHGDIAEIAIETGKDGKSSGTVEKLIESPLSEFTGRYIIKGKAHFVEPDLPRLSRWIFIPPKERKAAKEGDLIRCALSQHPFANGKPQAKILRVLGNTEQAGIEASYVIDKFQLPQQWPDNWQQQLLSPELQGHEDLCALPFVTIDGPETLDMDDALYAEACDTGWTLWIAIADPSSFIAPGSELDQAARLRASSIYLPGHIQPMLPAELANQQCSLVAGEQRPSLVCKLSISSTGDISDYQLFEAKITVAAKLSYQGVSEALATDTDSGHLAQLKTLQDCSRALLAQRQRDHLVMDDRPDYYPHLNEQGQIATIEKQHKTLAHSIVEECMIAANRCAADMLGEQGLFISHAGLREERLASAKTLASSELAYEFAENRELDNYIQLVKTAQQSESTLPVKTILTRWLERSQLSLSAQPHCGMGLSAYTTFTSPIRKYSDYLVHRLIKAKLNQLAEPALDEELLADLDNNLGRGKQARSQMERALYCRFLADKIGQSFSGTIVQLNSGGFTVRLDEFGIDGYVESRQLEGKYSFDPDRLTLRQGDKQFQLDQAVQVKVRSVDSFTRDIRFEWIANA
jgi:ribonuclease R